MSHLNMRLRSVACGALLLAALAAMAPARSDEGAAPDAGSPTTTSFSGYIIAVG